MCKQSTIDKIDAGTHIVLPKIATLFLSSISPISVIIGIFYFGGYINKIEAHVDDNDIHMEYTEKIKQFVPRTEIEYKLDGINSKLKKIVNKLDIIE